MNPWIVPIVVLVAALIGSVLRTIQGALAAVSGGEAFSPAKFWQSMITAVVQSLAWFGGLAVADITVTGYPTLMVLAAFACASSYLSNPDLGKMAATSIKKIGG